MTAIGKATGIVRKPRQFIAEDATSDESAFVVASERPVDGGIANL